MNTPVKVAGHPLHPMLIVFPLGLLGTAAIFDILSLFIDNPTLTVASYWMITAGLVGGLLAALFGFLDWLGLKSGTRAKSVGGWHGLGNLGIVLLFTVSWLLRRDAPANAPNAIALLLSVAGFGLSLITGWLGGEMVYRLGVAVDQKAHENAPSSLSTPASAIPVTGNGKQPERPKQASSGRRK
jgi:uncharacterized membrane protein